jgi:hypothetical protein
VPQFQEKGMAVSGVARISPMAMTREFDQAAQKAKVANVNFARSEKLLEGVQGTADVAVAVSDEASWAALASSMGAVLGIFGPYGRVAGIVLTVAGLVADRVQKMGEADAKAVAIQDRLKLVIENGKLLTDSAEERARKLADEARQFVDRDFDAIISELERENAALQAEVAEKQATLTRTQAGLDAGDERQRAFNRNDPTQKTRLDHERRAADAAVKQQKEAQELLAKARASKEEFLGKAADPPPDSELGRMLATGKVEQYSRTLAEARERANDCTGAVKEQTKALGEDTQARAESEAAIKAQNATLADGVKLVEEQTNAVAGFSEAEAKRKAELERFQADVGRTSAELSGVLSNAVWSGLTGGGDTKSIVDWFRNLFKKIATDALSTKIFMPIVQPIIGSVPGLFGIPAPANQNMAALPAGAQQGFGIPSLASGASSLWSLFNGTSPTLFNIGSGIATSSLGQSLGLSQSAVGLIPEAVAGDVMLTGAGGHFIKGVQAAPWGIIGSLGANMLGLGSANPVINMVSGTVGSVAGGMAGSAALGSILGAAGGPIGAVTGAFLGTALGGLFGGKPSVGPNYSVHFGPDGFQTALVDNDFSMDEAWRNGEALAASIAAITDLTGGRNTSRFGIGWTKNGFEIHNFGGVAGRMGQFQDIGATLRHALTREGAITGGDAEMMHVLSRSKANDAEGLVSDLQFAQGVLDLNRGLSQTAISIREVAKGYDEQIRRAKELGLATDALREARAKEIAGLREAEQRALAASEASLRIRELTLAGQDEEALRVRLEEQRAAELHSARQAVEAGLMTERQYKRLVSVLNGEVAQALKAFEEQAGQSAAALRNSAAQTATAAIGGIAQYVRSISIGDMSALAPERQFGLARSRFNAVSGAALAGDFGSLQQITSYADSLLRAARQQYGSGVGYADTFAQVTDVLSRLSAIDPERLTQRAFVTETRSQTQTLVTELQALRKEVEMLRREQQQGGNRPVRAA